mgnify:CR=1 FL=1
MFKFFFLLLVFSSCSNFNQKVSKNIIKANRFPAEESKSKLEVSYIGSDIGKIQYSMLTENKFRFINGNGWVLMDGRCVSKECCQKLKEKVYALRKCPPKGELRDSDYFLFTGNQEIPDVRGKFIRAWNGENLKEIEENCKALDYDNKGNCFDQEKKRKLGSYQSDDLKKHRHKVVTDASGHPGSQAGWLVRGKNPGTSENSNHDVTTENRPKNIAVNVFIKINEN